MFLGTDLLIFTINKVPFKFSLFVLKVRASRCCEGSPGLRCIALKITASSQKIWGPCFSCWLAVKYMKKMNEQACALWCNFTLGIITHYVTVNMNPVSTLPACGLCISMYQYHFGIGSLHDSGSKFRQMLKYTTELSLLVCWRIASLICCSIVHGENDELVEYKLRVFVQLYVLLMW